MQRENYEFSVLFCFLHCIIMALTWDIFSQGWQLYHEICHEIDFLLRSQQQFMLVNLWVVSLVLLTWSHNDIHNLWPITLHLGIYLKEITPKKNKGPCPKIFISILIRIFNNPNQVGVKYWIIFLFNISISPLDDIWSQSYSPFDHFKVLKLNNSLIWGY